jgi:hypothetical protein
LPSFHLAVEEGTEIQAEEAASILDKETQRIEYITLIKNYYSNSTYFVRKISA